MLKDENLYLVGGYVRDEFLGIPSIDIDYTYVGDAIAFAHENNLNIIKENLKFGTVRILSEGSEIDIASTRKETYPRKGHLPLVTDLGCSLEEDLLRRDFTINAIAKRTTDGKIVDIFNGVNDINNRIIKVLHKNSFVDDPTRIIRALKFSVRFNFELEIETKKMLENYLEHVNYDMSYHRVQKEFIETFNLNSQIAFDKFISWGVYRLLNPNVSSLKTNINIENLVNMYKPMRDVWFIYLALFNLDSLPLTRYQKRILEWVERLKVEEPANNTPKESIVIDKIRRSL